jgi:hypothetical protein
MMHFIEGTHYKRKENQPSPAPNKSKEDVEYMLCSGMGNDDDAQVGHGSRKMSRPIGLNTRIEWLEDV